MKKKYITCCKCAEKVAVELTLRQPQPHTIYRGPLPPKWRDLREKYFDDPDSNLKRFAHKHGESYGTLRHVAGSDRWRHLWNRIHWHRNPSLAPEDAKELLISMDDYYAELEYAEEPGDYAEINESVE